MDFAFPLVVCLLIGVMLAFALTAKMEPAERDWLRRWIIIALVLRLGIATVFALVPQTRMFHEDADGYEQVGMHIAAGWAHRGPPYPMPGELENRGFYYVSAAIYYLFFGIRAAVSYVNAIIGSVTVFYVYRLSRRFFHPIVGRLAAKLTVLTPSMILWSSIALKDPLMSLLVVMTLDSCIALRRRFSLGSLIGVAAPIVAMQPIRFYMIYFLGFAVVISLVVDRGTKLVTGVPKQLVLGGAIIGLLTLVGVSGSAQKDAELLTFARVSSFRAGMATTANSGFDADVDISTPARALAFLPIGVSFLLLSPFPWQFTSLRSSFALPEMIVWWALFPSLLGALAWTVRRRFSAVAPLVIFAGTMTAAYGLMHGNIGSGFRQRAQIFVVLFIFTSFGWYRRKCRRRGIDEDALFVAG